MAYANEKLILSGGHHFKTDINISDSNGGIDYQKVKFCLYRDASNENTSFRVDPSKPSEPEKHFEDMITRDIGKGYELVAYFKNPPFASQSSFVVGIRLTVAYEEDGKIKRWNFWPDYFLIVRSVKDGSLRPVIVEIKGDTSMDPKPLLQAKVQAAQTYMEHTGLMFTVMKEGKEKGTFYSSMSGEDMPQFLDNNWNRKMLDFENIEYASEDGLPKELEWMKDIGLIDTDSDSAI